MESSKQINRIDIERDADVVGPGAVHEEGAQARGDGGDAAGAEEDLEAVAFVEAGDGRGGGAGDFGGG